MENERPQIRKYLLGELPEDEAAQVDERLFASDEVLREMDDEQELLIEDFINRRLSAQEEASFRSQYARSPALRSQVEEMQTLLASLRGRVEVTRTMDRTRPHRRIFMFLSPALAAALCLTVWLYRNQHDTNTRLRAQVESATSAGSAVQPVAQSSPSGQEQVIFLAANVVRGTTSMPILKVAPSTATIELQIEVRGSEPGDEWSAAISESGQPVWMSSRVPVRRIGTITYLDAHLDASLLKPGDYVLRIVPSQGTSIAQTRPFVVVKSKY